MNDDILQKQVLSSTVEFRVSDIVQEFKIFISASAMCYLIIWRLCENLFPYQLPTRNPNPW